MPATPKRMKPWKDALPPGKQYPIDAALQLVKNFAKAKFNESVDAAINLGIDASKSDQQVRGSTVMPNGIGKTVRVAVFTSARSQEAAKAAGADVVGLEDLAEKVKAGQIDFDVVIASPDAMRVVGQLGQILGPRGLMPNPKVGTVSPDVAGAVKNAKSGQVRYRVDKAGIVHCTIGKASFEANQLKENLLALLAICKKRSLRPRRACTSSGSRCPRLWVRACRSIRDRSVSDRGVSEFLIDAGSAPRGAGFHRRPQAGRETAHAFRQPLMIACAGGVPLRRGSSSYEGHRR